MKKYIIFSLIFALVFTVSIAFAKPNKQAPDVVPLTIPGHAVEVAPGVFSLGIGSDNGRMVQGYAFVHYKGKNAKPSGCKDDGVCQGWEDPTCADCTGGGGNGEEPDDSSCYGFLAKGAIWKTVEPYVVNPTNIRGLDEGSVTSNIAMDIAKWETAAGVNILGNGSTTNEQLVADFYSTDGKNEVYFGSIDEPGVIAIAVVWGYFSGPPFARELVEWDMVFDDVDFDWSEDCKSYDCTDKMDFANIATHELGHAVGMDDLYDDKCSEQTMYGYASFGETKKRTLEAGDIAGVSKLYQ